MEKEGKLSYSMEFAWTKEVLLQSACLSIQRWMVTHDWNDTDCIYNSDYIAIESLILIKDYQKAIEKYNNIVWTRGITHLMYTVSVKVDYVAGTIPTDSSITNMTIGHACKKCTTYYEYAKSNQGDGTYLCKSCSIFSNIFSA